MKSVVGKIYNFEKGIFFDGEIKIKDGKIIDIVHTSANYKTYIVPGLIDSHVHVESSLLLPVMFSRAAIKHGTVAAIADPHEIANVLGKKGIQFLEENGKLAEMKFFFGAPPCVPATNFETSGASISDSDIEYLFSSGICHHMAEVMNYPGVINQSPELIKKILIAKSLNKVIDGHAPKLTGDEARKYFHFGISTDHECEQLEEALEKISYNSHILIREGSAAKNFDSLAQILEINPEKAMFCTDDCHADELLAGHINRLVKRAIKLNIPLKNIILAASVNPVLHYKLPVGLLRKGDNADFLVIDSPENYSILETWINGNIVYSEKSQISPEVSIPNPENNFSRKIITAEDIKLYIPHNKSKILTIVAKDNSLITEYSLEVPTIGNNREILANPGNDVLKLVNVCRYSEIKPTIAFIKGFKLRSGAIASSIAHDSHNILALGTNDADILEAVNIIIHSKGGLAAVNGNEKVFLPLPYAGLMSNLSAQHVAAIYHELNEKAKAWGCTFDSPFMTLSFMALLVIPNLKLSDKGLFDSKHFSFVEMFW